MQIIEKNIKDLKPYDNNPRLNDKAVKYVAKSIEEFGFKVPIVIDKDGVVVCGHTRLKASTRLKLEKVPCIIADDLTEEQIKAFRLADNKVSEQAEWDFEMLDDEINDILEFDMQEFGFEFKDEEKNKEVAHRRFANILNLELASFPGAGLYDIPVLKPVRADEIGYVEEWIDFDMVKREKYPENKGVHFFIHDYKFERIWNNPQQYVEKLKQFKVVTTPDFSPYGDMPLAAQIFNHYRKHWVGAFLQANGVRVIPTIRASTDERSLQWFLDGEPTNGVVCISNMWTSDEEERKYFLKSEFQTMVSTLNPEKIFVYGSEMPELTGNIEYIETWSKKKWSKCE